MTDYQHFTTQHNNICSFACEFRREFISLV